MLCLSVVAVAQNTISKIPSDASIVATIKGKNLLQLMSMEEINNSFVGIETLKEMSRKNSDFKSLEDFGFNLGASSHYFFQANDSINYNAFIIPIKDVNKFEALVSSQGKKEIVSQNGVRTTQGQSEVAIFWDASAFVVVEASMNNYFFQDETVMERYGLKSESTETYEDEVEETVIESTEVSEEVYEEEEIEETVIESTEDYNANDDNYSYYDVYDANNKIKRELSENWATLKALQILKQSPNRSILKNKSYLKSLDDNAEATLWVHDFGQLYSNVLGGLYFSELAGFDLGQIYANNGLSAKLLLENDRMEFSTSYRMSDQMAESYKKMTSRKLNKKFLDYVNEDRMIGYMSYAMDTKATLEEYPVILKSIYKNIPYYGEEAVLGLDMFSLLLDEAAVGEVLNGDLLFLLSGISKQEVTYTTYEYNDDYEYIEVEKTKTETIPDFLLMASTEDSSMFTKLIQYAVNKEMVTFDNGYYTFVIPKSPLSLHFVIKDGIAFLGTSKAEMRKITTGTFDAKLSSKHKKRMLDNSTSLFVSAEQLASQLPIEEMGLDGSGKLEWFLNTSEDAYMTASKIKGNTVETKMVVGVPGSEKNALQYIFTIIDKFAK
jgi:hypothetical protein